MIFFRNTLTIGMKLVIFLIVTGIVLAGSSYFFEKTVQKNVLRTNVTQDVSVMKERFSSLEKTNTSGLGIAADVFSINERAKELFLAGDRDGLYEYAFPLFEELRDRHGITHMYFHALDDTVFLRMHSRDIFGDTVQRETFTRAKDSGEVGFGFELGKTAFALRVVRPYFEQDRRIGYVEFGREIDEFLEILKRETGDDFSLVGNKSLLDRTEWEKVYSDEGANFLWDDDSTYAALGETAQGTQSFCFDPGNALDVVSEEVFDFSRQSQKRFICNSFPIYNLNEKEIGRIFWKEDISGYVENGRSSIFLFLTFFLGIFLGALLLFFLVIRTLVSSPLHTMLEAIRGISFGKTEIVVPKNSGCEFGEIFAAFNEMLRKIRDKEDHLEEEVRKRTVELESMNEFMVGREIRMVELKKEMEQIKKKKQ